MESRNEISTFSLFEKKQVVIHFPLGIRRLQIVQTAK